LKIKSLHVKNFKNIKDVTLTTENRVVVIVGDTGSGKSSILSALGYLLTDSLDDKISEYVRWGCKKFEIECEFNHNGVDYCMEVEGEKSAKKTLYIGDEVYNNSEATKKLSEIIDPTITKYSAISEQGKTTQLLFQKPAERLKTLKEILKIDSINDIVENMKEDAKKIKTEIEVLEGEIKTLESRTFSFMDLPEVPNIDNVLKEKIVLEKQKEEYEAKKKAYDEYVLWKVFYDDTVAKKESLEEQIKKENDVIKNIEEPKPEFVFDTELYEKLKTDYNTILRQEAKYESAKQAYDDYVIKCNKVKKDIEDIDKKISDIKLSRIKSLMYTEEEYKKNDEAISECRSNITVLKDKIRLAELGMCPTCGQEYNVNAETLKGDYVVLQDVLNNHIALKQEFDLDKKRYENEQAELRDNKARVDAYKQKKEMLETSLHPVINEPEKLDKSSVDIKITLNKMDEDKINLQKIIDYNKDLLNQNNLSKQKVALLQFQITELKVGDKPEEVASVENEFPLKAEFKKCEESIILYNGAKAEYERVVKFNDGIRKERDESAVVIQAKFDKKFELHRQFTLLTSSKDILNNDFSSYMVDKGAEFLKTKMNDFFRRTYGKYNITFQKDKGSIDFFFQDGDNKETPCSMLSGYEKDVCATANRIALSSLQHLGFMIVDEIDAHASDSRSVELFDSILSEKQIGQIFVITHNEASKEYFSNSQNCKIVEVTNGMILN